MNSYTKDDFLDTTKPFEELSGLSGDPFQHERQLTILSDQARQVGVRNFRKLYAEYCRSQRKVQMQGISSNLTRFTGQPIELDSGNWEADDLGVTGIFVGQEQQACCHPILPFERLANVDTGIEKLKLAFCKGERWRTVIADKKTLASSTAILALADHGIAVNSENAKFLVQYLHDLENLNYERIPEMKSVNRLGWIDEHGFSPYVSRIVFDGEIQYRSLFEYVSAYGRFEDWLKVARDIRQGSLTARIMLAASFASVLVKPCGCLPFFVHLWGTESGTGKTVALMVAASVWANPEVGKYIQTFNSTAVGREKLAAFCNSMPLIIDELQLSRDQNNRQAFDVYALAEGVGRTRGTKGGGMEKTAIWNNCILTTGETPMNHNNVGAGAMNRVIEIECKSDEVVVANGHRIANQLRQAFGHAGKLFVSFLDRSGLERAQSVYAELFRALTASEATEKQAMAAALILAADRLSTEWIFKDDRAISVDDIQAILMTKDEVSANLRAYDFICDWVRQNKNRFDPDTSGDFFGEIKDGRALIIPSIFNRTVEDEGFSSKGFSSWLKSKKLIETEPDRLTIKKVVGGNRIRCVSLRLPDSETELPWWNPNRA